MTMQGERYEQAAARALSRPAAAGQDRSDPARVAAARRSSSGGRAAAAVSSDRAASPGGLTTFDVIAMAWAPRVLSILRVMTGLLLLQHGTAKVLKFPFVEKMANTNLMSLSGIAGILELVGGVLLVLGLFTRPTAFILSGLMAVAYFMVHAPRGFYPILNEGELAVLYCFVLLYLAAAGSGPWSLDALRKK